MEEKQLENNIIQENEKAIESSANNLQHGNNQQLTESLEEIANKKRVTLKLGDVIVPIALGILLIILGVFVFIPMISSTLKYVDQYEETKKKEERLTLLKNNLDKIDDSIMQVDLINAKNVIPKELKVSSFIFYIDDLAKELNLSSKSLSGSDIKVSSSEEEQTEQKYLGVSGPVAYVGSFENILKFLNDLYSASPYIVSVSNVTIEREGVGTGMWKASLNLTGYYVRERESIVDLNKPLTVYSTFGDTVKVFEEKANKLRE